MSWGSDLLIRFPDWRSDAVLSTWPAVKASISVGQQVSGVVIARAPFGVWLDIGVAFPALLLVRDIGRQAMSGENLGDEIPCVIAERIEIGIDTTTLTRQDEFSVCHVAQHGVRKHRSAFGTWPRMSSQFSFWLPYRRHDILAPRSPSH